MMTPLDHKPGPLTAFRRFIQREAEAELPAAKPQAKEGEDRFWQDLGDTVTGATPASAQVYRKVAGKIGGLFTGETLALRREDFTPLRTARMVITTFLATAGFVAGLIPGMSSMASVVVATRSGFNGQPTLQEVDLEKLQEEGAPPLERYARAVAQTVIGTIEYVSLSAHNGAEWLVARAIPDHPGEAVKSAVGSTIKQAVKQALPDREHVATRLGVEVGPEAAKMIAEQGPDREKIATEYGQSAGEKVERVLVKVVPTKEAVVDTAGKIAGSSAGLFAFIPHAIMEGTAQATLWGGGAYVVLDPVVERYEQPGQWKEDLMAAGEFVNDKVQERVVFPSLLVDDAIAAKNVAVTVGKRTAEVVSFVDKKVTQGALAVHQHFKTPRLMTEEVNRIGDAVAERFDAVSQRLTSWSPKGSSEPT